MIHTQQTSRGACPTLAAKLGIPTHLSLLLRKLAKHGLKTPKELAAAAVGRGCFHYEDFAGGLQIDSPAISNEELAIALLSPCNPYQPQLIRIASQLLSSPDTNLRTLAQLAIEERCAPILKYIALCGSKTEPDLPFWNDLLSLLGDCKAAPSGVMPHISRFRSETGIVNPKRPLDPKIIWLRPSRKDSQGQAH